MITSFFSRTKPITYLVLFVMLGIYLILSALFDASFAVDGSLLLTIGASLVLFIIQLLLIDQFVTKVRKTELSAFPMLFFALFCIAFYEILLDLKLIAANAFLIMATLELLQIESGKKYSVQVFNAAFWVCIASIFYPLALFYLIVVYTAVYMFCSNHIRNWLMPIMAVGTYLLLALAFSLIWSDKNMLVEHYSMNFSVDFFGTLDFQHYTRLSLFIVSVSLLSIFVFIRSKSRSSGKSLDLSFLLLTFFIGIVITVIGADLQNGVRAILFTFCPASILITSYFETFRRKRLREYILLFCLIVPLTFALVKILLQDSSELIP